MTSLLLAIVNGHAETVRVLVENGASLNAVDEVNILADALEHMLCEYVCVIMRILMCACACVCVCLCVCFLSNILMYRAPPPLRNCSIQKLSLSVK